MKHLLIAAFLSSFLGFSAFALEASSRDFANSALDQYMGAKVAAENCGWAYLGCAGSKEACQGRAIQRGYSQIRIYSMCGPRNQYPYSCFARMFTDLRPGPSPQSLNTGAGN